eukprot:scaffold18427_cov103-Skeletonema_marinoi.AAC.4
MQHQPPSSDDAKSKSRSSSALPFPTTTSYGGSYVIRLSGLSIFIAILSSAFIALFSGRMASSYMSTPRLQQFNCQPAAADNKLTETVENVLFDYEALVHPAMITHPNPKR